MKSYKSFNKAFIGASDIASLTVRSCGKVAVLNFGSDGSYHAYIVKGEAEIGTHYELVFECENWLKVYDDCDLTYGCLGKTIKIYRAGDFGCIIQILN